MSINRDMRGYRLLKKSVTRTDSGAEQKGWKFSGMVQAAVYKKNESKMYGSEVYLQATHTGVTKNREIEVGDRLEASGTIYQVESCNPESRLTNLILKVIENG